MKVLVTGSNGLLGQKLIRQLAAEPDMEVAGIARGENRIHSDIQFRYYSADLSDAAAIETVINDFKPDALIHTAAMTNVDACELDPEACRRNNVLATANLLHTCHNKPVYFIYISTDFVFDGKNGPYRETDPCGPLSVYAQSKLDSEILVQNSELPYAILRTMIVYGVTDDSQRSNLILWTKQSLSEGKTIRVISDQYRGPTLAEDLSDACVRCLRKRANGIYHISGREVMSILEIAQKVAEYFKLDSSLIQPVTTAELAQPAARPLRTGFIIDKAERELDYHPHSLLEGIALVDLQLQKK